MIKFPHTPHLAWLGMGTPRQDKVLSPAEQMDFLSHPIVVEEKVDGANVGISFVEGAPVVWNRGTVLRAGAHPQFQRLWPWLAGKQSRLAETLGGRLALFGEWCFAVHSVHYDRLPDYFLVIDIYDQVDAQFWSSERRDELADQLGLTPVPRIACGEFSLAQLRTLLVSSTSRLGQEPMEGLYLRREEGDRLEARAKLVRPEFVQSIEEHWTNRPLEKNIVSRSTC